MALVAILPKSCFDLRLLVKRCFSTDLGVPYLYASISIRFMEISSRCKVVKDYPICHVALSRDAGLTTRDVRLAEVVTLISNHITVMRVRHKLTP